MQFFSSLGFLLYVKLFRFVSIYKSCTTFYMVTIRQHTAVDQYAFQALYSTFCLRLISLWGPGLHSRHSASTGWTVWGSGPDVSKISLFHTLPDQPRSPYSLLYDGYRGCFPGVKRPGHGVDRPSPSTAKYTLFPLCISMAC
jgi:hypothetical protein